MGGARKRRRMGEVGKGEVKKRRGMGGGVGGNWER